MILKNDNINDKIRWKELITAIAIPLAVGGLSAFLTRDSMKKFSQLNQPPLSPPAWLFPVVWTILFALMGWASYRIYVSDASRPRKRRALTVYGVQLAFNFLWSLIFFNLGAYLAAFAVLMLLWLLIIVTLVSFWYIDSIAGELLIPYVLWVTFAAYLNLSIYLLNG